MKTFARRTASRSTQRRQGLALRAAAATLLFAFSACSGSGGIGAVSCGPGSSAGSGAPSTSSRIAIGQLPAVDTDKLLAHTTTLSSDEYQGRAPGTNGEELSVSYLVDQFKNVGLKPG